MSADSTNSLRFRKLRIAWSVGCGILCLLLIVSWVRSLHAEDRLSGNFSRSLRFRVYSSHGCLVCYAPGTPGQQDDYPWQTDFASDFWLKESDPRIASVPRVHHHPQEMWLTLPHWLLVGVCAAFTALPWIPWRFSLRTLLIGMTVVAVVLGLIVYAVN